MWLFNDIYGLDFSNAESTKGGQRILGNATFLFLCFYFSTIHVLNSCLVNAWKKVLPGR